MSIGVSYDRWKEQSHDSRPNVVLACGPETTLKEEFRERLEERFPADDREVLSLYADEVEPEDLVQELRGQGLFSREKWVVLKRLGQREPGGTRPLARLYDTLEEYLQDPEPDTLLILQDADHPYEKGRKTGSMARAVESAGGWAIVFWPPFMNRLADRFRTAFEEEGVELDEGALDALLERSQGQYDHVRKEAEKLLETDRETITREDVERLVPRAAAGEGYQALEETLAEGNLAGALNHVEDLWRQRESEPRVFTAVFRFFNQLRRLRQLRRDGSLDGAMDQLGLPDQKSVRRRFRSAVNTYRGPFPPDFYRLAYRAARTAKYAPRDLARRSVEKFILRILPRLEPG